MGNEYSPPPPPPRPESFSSNKSNCQDIQQLAISYSELLNIAYDSIDTTGQNKSEIYDVRYALRELDNYLESIIRNHKYNETKIVSTEDVQKKFKKTITKLNKPANSINNDLVNDFIKILKSSVSLDEELLLDSLNKYNNNLLIKPTIDAKEQPKISIKELQPKSTKEGNSKVHQREQTKKFSVNLKRFFTSLTKGRNPLFFTSRKKNHYESIVSNTLNNSSYSLDQYQIEANEEQPDESNSINTDSNITSYVKVLTQCFTTRQR